MVAVDADQLAALAADPQAIVARPVEGLSWGAFLDGKSLPNAELSDWLAFERTRCRTLAQTVLGSAAERLESGGDVSYGFYLEHPSYLSLALVTCSPNRSTPELACPVPHA